MLEVELNKPYRIVLERLDLLLTSVPSFKGVASRHRLIILRGIIQALLLYCSDWYCSVPLFKKVHCSVPHLFRLVLFCSAFQEGPLFCSALLRKVNKTVPKSVDNTAILLYNIPILNEKLIENFLI